ncbi:MAG TPA: formylglycine-generating enzyme family protein [Verrucomicrobiae bacterium]|jgi:formylglycine-generating enzyme required for sulfatase activity|nr:formylglycine-generating enzyme family protein [Verrucomicrobiae bacterium]
MKIFNFKTFIMLASLLGVANSVWSQTPASLNIQFSNGYARLDINGTASNACTVQYTTNLVQSNPWHYQANFLLTNSEALFLDTNQSLSTTRFYRIFTQQLPTNVVPLANMIWISPGTFTMGSPTNEAERIADETQHTVTLSRGFYMGRYLVTQGDYLALIGSNPSYFPTNHVQNLNLPVEEVNWDDATNYCAQLTQQEALAGRLPLGWSYRLPTESEWEYACRAGTTTAFYYGNALRSGMANFDGTREYDSTGGTITNLTGINLAQTTVVGSYEANAWGLSDMCGNVEEWCWDWYGTYPSGNVTDPQGPATGPSHIVRGGAWFYPGVSCRSAERGDAFGFFNFLGFRVVLAPN